MKNVLVTGANGQLGKCIQKRANQHDDLTFHFYDAKKLNITSNESISEVFESLDFDYCINCAAFTNVELAEKEPEQAYKINAEGVKNLALSCKQYGICLIHISTDYVFDGKKKTPYEVKDQTNPINAYGKSKLKGEQYIQEIAEKYFILRTSWLYSEFGNNFYKAILKKAKEGENLTVTDDQKGCPTNANNLAKFIIKLINSDSNKYEILHFTDGEVMTWYDFAQRILSENNLLDKVKLDKAENYRTFAARPKYSVLKLQKGPIK